MTFRRTMISAFLLAGLAACSPKPAPAASASSGAGAVSPAMASETVDPNARLDVDLTFASTSPFWHAMVTGPDHAIQVVRPMRDDDLAAKPVVKIEADKASFSGMTAKDGEVTLTAERKPCRPRGDQPLWPFTSTLTIEGHTYPGCASPGSPRIPG